LKRAAVHGIVRAEFMAKVEISASVLNADFTRLGAQIEEADRAGVDRFHMDVMDGRFVPNISFGPLVVEAARRCTRKPVEAHLMIVEPDRYIPQFAKAGADVILVHQEACSNLRAVLAQIRGLGKRPGVVVNPATPLATLGDVLGEVDQILVMSVNPGFGGQSFIEGSLDKLTKLRAMLDERQLSCAVEVDGGVGPKNAGTVARAGADVLVVGAAIFKAPDGIPAAVAALRAASA
jgi:ribulose-phosphate 3-epimerase